MKRPPWIKGSHRMSRIKWVECKPPYELISFDELAELFEHLKEVVAKDVHPYEFDFNGALEKLVPGYRDRKYVANTDSMRVTPEAASALRAIAGPYYAATIKLLQIRASKEVS
jgi:hypothetical protein